MPRGTACILLHHSGPFLQSVLLLCLQKALKGFAQVVYLNMARLGDLDWQQFFQRETGCRWSDWIRRSGEVAVVTLASPVMVTTVFHRLICLARPSITVQQCRCRFPVPLLCQHRRPAIKVQCASLRGVARYPSPFH